MSDYWDERIVVEIVTIFKEFINVFSFIYGDFKGNTREYMESKIELYLYA